MPSQLTTRELPTLLAPKDFPTTLLWRELFELSQDGLAFTSGESHVVRCMNARFRELLPPPRDRSSFRFGEEFGDVQVAMLDRVYASGVRESSADAEHRFADGRLGCFTYTFASVREPSAGVRGLIVTVRDTTDQMLRRREFARSSATMRTLNERLVVSSVREQELAESEATQRAQLNALLAKLSDGVLVAEPSGRITMLNPAACAMMGVGCDELRTVGDLDRLEVHDLAGKPRLREALPILRALRGEDFAGDEVLGFPSHGGEPLRVVSTGTSVRDADGRVALAIVVFRDVTELRRLEQQREEYTALISHDLRNPLGAILMCSTLLRRSMQKKGLAEDASLALRIERNGVRMNVMIQELLDATSLELHAVALRQAPLDLWELVVGVVQGLDDASTRRIAIEAKDESPCIVFAEAPRLERCVLNLITNALKYSAADSPVRLRLFRDQGRVVLDVIDCGIGIAPETAKRLFDRYYRSAGGKAQAEGLGLGLYIARLIVEAHGGRIEVLSEIGKGSTFRLILPPYVKPS